MFKPFGHGYTPKKLSIDQMKQYLKRFSMHGEAHVDNLFSETLKYIEELEIMVGYKSKKFLAESREPDVPDVSYHYRETNDMIMEKANSNLFYNLRHLKMFKERTKMEKSRWFITWDDGKNIVVHDDQNVTICELDDIVMAEYICSLHNMSFMLIKEVEDKYAEC